ncbi:MAG: hypothetical protein A3F93_01620 [Candidatus Magasanikbacteria bacterium RIFCSPLOWO2_12_FULL_34_7]|nr:MAG: hypothetical protein A3F93_01620 [Candidatus Magasanikbacteria bacterium RIFCSPLOWO2_12_FULL_34_7]
MQTKVNTLSPDDTFAEAIKKMLEAKTNGMVVVNKDFKIEGILSSWDLIQYLVPDYLEEDKHLASFESADVFAKRALEIKDEPVSKFMTKSVHTCNSSDSLMEAAIILSEFKIRQLPVVDENNKLVGYINRTDIKRAIGDVLNLQ